MANSYSLQPPFFCHLLRLHLRRLRCVSLVKGFRDIWSIHCTHALGVFEYEAAPAFEKCWQTLHDCDAVQLFKSVFANMLCAFSEYVTASDFEKRSQALHHREAFPISLRLRFRLPPPRPLQRCPLRFRPTATAH